MIIESAKRGDTFEMFASSIEVHLDTILEWAKVHKDFSLAKKKAKQEQLNYMLKLGRAGMLGVKTDASGKVVIPNFNATMWIFMMKARFGWRENQDAETEEVGLEFV